MDLKELKKLISLMNENGLIELEISEEGKRCVLKKPPPYGAEWNHEAPPMQGLAHPHANGGLASAAPAVPAPKAAVTPSLMDGAITFNSPIVGTFYRSSTPGAEPFVKAGDRINAETVVCLIEAMK